MRLPALLHDDSVTIVSVTEGFPDDYGVPTVIKVETPWDGVNVQQTTTTEDNNSREQATRKYRVAGPVPPVQIENNSLIKWRGEDYRVEGEPDTRTGYGRLNHTSLIMVRVTG